MKRFVKTRPDTPACDQKIFRKGSHNKGRVADSLSNPWRDTRLPFVLVLTVVAAIVAAGLTFGHWRSGFEGSRVVDQHSGVGAKVGGPKPAVQPRADVFPSRTGGMSGLGNSGGVEKNIYSPGTNVGPISPTITRTQQSQKIPQVVEMTIGEDAEESSENSPLLRSARSPYSSATANSGERDREGKRERYQEQDAGRTQLGESVATSRTPDQEIDSKPKEERLIRAHQFRGDLRNLPRTRPPQRERRELEPPENNPRLYVPPGGLPPQSQTPETQPSSTGNPPTANPPAPPPTNVFEGLDRFNWGAGSPPDTNGDVGPNDYIQTVNTSIGIFRKSDGFQEAAFTFNTFMSQGSLGNL